MLGFGPSPYITRPNPKAPAGVVLSPSRLWSEIPRWPSQADHAPATPSQQVPDRRHSRSCPRVEDRLGATTVTSCLADRVEASSFGRLGGQVATCACLASEEPAAQSARHPRSA